MGVLREWRCLEHGEFDCSHGICPESGCDSKHVVQEFRTPPMVGSRMVRQFDAGMKKTSDMMKIGNFRTARAGESAHGGHLASQVLWGDDCRKVFGRSFGEMVGMAHKPLVVQKRDGSGELRLDRNNAMREAATDIGLTGRRVPKPGELRVSRDDKKSAPVAKQVAS